MEKHNIPCNNTNLMYRTFISLCDYLRKVLFKKSLNKDMFIYKKYIPRCIENDLIYFHNFVDDRISFSEYNFNQKYTFEMNLFPR